MSDSVFLVLDFGAICRLCLNARGRLLTDIFHYEDPNEEDVPLLHEQISLLTGVQISPTDKLPQQICYKCRHLVDMCYELRDSTERAHRLLTTAAGNVASAAADTNLHGTVKTEHREILQDETLESLINEEFLDPTHPEQIAEDLVDPGYDDVGSGDDIKLEYVETAVVSDTRKKTSPKKRLKKKPTRTRFICEICLSTFPSKDKQFQHIRQHYEDSDLTPYIDLKKPYACERCDQRVTSRKQVVLHHLRHLNLNPFVCRQAGCNFVGKSKETLRQHSYKHKTPSFVCEACGVSFRRNFSLKQHMIRHEDKGARYPCRQCGVVCSNRITYRTHILSHERGRRYKCDRAGCPKAFFHRTDLLTHTRSHNNERVYRCHLCVSTYISQSQLNRHLRQHQHRRINKCDKCCATFDNYTAFCNHRISTHGAWQPHKCIGCNQGYQSEGRLEKHMLRCKLALNVKNLLRAEETTALELPTPREQHAETAAQGLLCSEESMDTLDSLLLRNLRTGPVIVEPGNLHSVKTLNGETRVLPPDGLLYIEVDDDELSMLHPQINTEASVSTETVVASKHDGA